MDRRKFTHGCLIGILTIIGGCINRSGEHQEQGSTETTSKKDYCAGIYTKDDPHDPHDELTIFQFPEYVNMYDEVLIIEYSELDPESQQAIDAASSSNGTFIECINSGSKIKSLFSEIEEKWEASNDDFNDNTYLFYENAYYGLTIIEEGDTILIDSIPCTDESCPATPTPPSSD